MNGTWIGVLAIGALSAFALAPQTPASPARRHVVFEVNVEGQEQWQAVLANVENLERALAPIDVEVVTHGKGLGLLLKENNPLAGRLQALSQAGVKFAACQNTMRRMKIGADALLPFAVPVDSGVAEVVRRQGEGWAYIKAGA